MLDIESLVEILEETAGGGGGSIVTECTCGKTYFVSEGDYDEGELERLRSQQVADPKHYIEVHDDSYVSHKHIGGRRYVICCDCGWQQKYAGFLWSERDVITRFYERAFRRLLSDAQREKGYLDRIHNLIETNPQIADLKVGTKVQIVLKPPEDEARSYYPQKTVGIIVGIYNQGNNFLVWGEIGTKLYYIPKKDVIQAMDQLTHYEILTHDSEIVRQIGQHFMVSNNENPKI